MKNKKLFFVNKSSPTQQQGLKNATFDKVCGSYLSRVKGLLPKSVLCFDKLSYFNLRVDFDFRFNLHWNIKWQLRHANSTARVSADLRAIEIEDEIGEPIDNTRLFVETWSRVNHAEDATPGSNAVEVTESALQTAEDGKCGQTGGGIALLDGQFPSEFAQWPRNGAVGVLSAVS
jgi:hypothetical protein